MRTDHQAHSADTFAAHETAVPPTARPTGLPTFIGLSISTVGRIFQSLTSHPRNKTGATAIEYGIMVALIATAVIATVFVISGQTDATFALLANG